MTLKTSLLVEEGYKGSSKNEFLHIMQPGDILDIEWDSRLFYMIPRFKITNRTNGMVDDFTLGIWNQILNKSKITEL